MTLVAGYSARKTLSRSTFSLTIFLLLGCLATLNASAQPPGSSPTYKQQGWWSSAFDWGVQAIHLALMRSQADPNHSQVSVFIM
jgi:hypothetical protein